VNLAPRREKDRQSWLFGKQRMVMKNSRCTVRPRRVAVADLGP
jgi:hypothetical protein